MGVGGEGMRRRGGVEERGWGEGERVRMSEERREGV